MIAERKMQMMLPAFVSNSKSINKINACP